MGGDKYVPIPRKVRLSDHGLGWGWWRGFVMLECTNGHRHPIDFKAHVVAPDGATEPSLVCPAEGCTFHVYGRLQEWRGDEGTDAHTGDG